MNRRTRFRHLGPELQRLDRAHERVQRLRQLLSEAVAARDVEACRAYDAMHADMSYQMMADYIGVLKSTIQLWIENGRQRCKDG